MTHAALHPVEATGKAFLVFASQPVLPDRAGPAHELLHAAFSF